MSTPDSEDERQPWTRSQAATRFPIAGLVGLGLLYLFRNDPRTSPGTFWTIAGWMLLLELFWVGLSTGVRAVRPVAVAKPRAQLGTMSAVLLAVGVSVSSRGTPGAVDYMGWIASIGFILLPLGFILGVAFALVRERLR